MSSDIHGIGYYQRKERTVVKVINDFAEMRNSNKRVVKFTNLLNVKETEKFEYVGSDVWTILKWILRKYMSPRIAYMRIRYSGSLLRTISTLLVP